MSVLRRYAESDPLYDACAAGDTHAVRQLLSLGTSANVRDILGQMPLFAAAITGNAEICRILLDHGAEIDARNASGLTPLAAHIDACTAAGTDVARMLLAAGASANAVDALERTLLMRETRRGRPAMYRLLLEHGADVSAAEQAGFTALHLAAERGLTEMCMTLIEAGADVNDGRRHILGWTPLRMTAGQSGFSPAMDTAVALLHTRQVDFTVRGNARAVAEIGVGKLVAALQAYAWGRRSAVVLKRALRR